MSVVRAENILPGFVVCLPFRFVEGLFLMAHIIVCGHVPRSFAPQFALGAVYFLPPLQVSLLGLCSGHLGGDPHSLLSAASLPKHQPLVTTWSFLPHCVQPSSLTPRMSPGTKLPGLGQDKICSLAQTAGKKCHIKYIASLFLSPAVSRFKNFLFFVAINKN